MKTHKIPGNLKANSSQKKFSSNESAWKMKKKWAITDQMVLKIFHFKVRNLSKLDVAVPD